MSDLPTQPSTADHPSATGIRADLVRLDRAVYAAVGTTPTESLDHALRRLTLAANHSKLWMATAAVLAVFGGQRGRRGAAAGMTSIAMASFTANLILKPIARRRRPDRDRLQTDEDRLVEMPTSSSFPSGHSASALAFATAVSREIPWLGTPLRAMAATVAYSRVHTGVHYPGDVLAGAIVGGAIGDLAGPVQRSLTRRLRQRW